MDIWMIWAEDQDGEFHWLEEAWDDESTAENHKGWQDAVAKAYAAHGPERVRIIKSRIDFDAVVAAFRPASVGMSKPEVA